MKKKYIAAIIIAVIALFIVGCVSTGAQADDEPATDTGYWGLAVPHAERFMLYSCTSKTVMQKPCYYNVREYGHTGKQSFWIIKVGNYHCKKFWDNRYDRTHGFCRR